MSWSTYAQLKRPRQQVVVRITSSLVRAFLLMRLLLEIKHLLSTILRIFERCDSDRKSWAIMAQFCGKLHKYQWRISFW